MKLPYLLLLPALLGSQLAAAQQRLNFGAKAGVNYATYLHQITDNSRAWGLNAGVVGRYALSANNVWNIQSELLYSGKGVRFSTTPKSSSRLHYLDLPVLLQIHARGLLFEAGPQLSSVVANRYTNELGTYHRSRSEFSALQLGYVVGIGYELKSGPSLTLRCTNDVTGLNSWEGFGGTSNSVLQAQLGYMFGRQ